MSLQNEHCFTFTKSQNSKPKTLLISHKQEC